MKKLSKVLLGVVAVAAIFLVPSLAFAQDSTAVANPATGMIDTVVSALEIKWPIIGTIGTILFFVSEGLSLIPSVKSNGIFQLIASALTKLFKKP